MWLWNLSQTVDLDITMPVCICQNNNDNNKPVSLICETLRSYCSFIDLL